MIKDEYKDLPEDEFVPLDDAIDPIFSGEYLINKLGWIKTVSTGKIRKSFYIDPGGYPVVSFRKSKTKRLYHVHRLVALIFIFNENPEEKIFVDHINHDRKNFSIQNLRWVTPSENKLNSSTSKPRKQRYYIKLDNSGNELEKLDSTSISHSMKVNINNSVKRNNKYLGHKWKIEWDDQEVLDYYKWIRSIVGDGLKEEFKDIPGQPSKIKISNYGVIQKSNGELSLGTLTGGRRVYSGKLVHRLVAESHILGRIMSESEVVDHIDTNPLNNSVANLKVTDQKGNLNNPLTKVKIQKRVLQFSLTGEFIREYESGKEASEFLSLKYTYIKNIQSCCRGEVISTCGFLWCYDGEEDKIPEKVAKLKK